MADQNTALKIVEAKKKITKTVNRHYSKTQPIVRPGIFDDGGDFDAYKIGVGRFMWAIVSVVFIIPISIIAGMIGGISQGLQDGIELISDVYKSYLGV